MIDNVAVGTEIRVTTDKWESAGFGPEKGEIGTVTTSGFTGADELPVLFSTGVYFVKDGEFETLEDAAFQPGDRVRIVSSPDPLVEVGSEGVVMSLDDPRLFLVILFGGPPPADLNIVDFEDGFIGLKNNEIELIERVSDSAADTVAGLDSDPTDAPVSTHIILTTDIFKHYATGDRGVVVKHGAYHVVEMEDGGELYLDPSEFVVAGQNPATIEAGFVAFELLNAGHFGGTKVQLLHCGGGYYNLAITNGYNSVAPYLTAAERRLLGQALIESAEHGE